MDDRIREHAEVLVDLSARVEDGEAMTVETEHRAEAARARPWKSWRRSRRRCRCPFSGAPSESPALDKQCALKAAAGFVGAGPRFQPNRLETAVDRVAPALDGAGSVVPVLDAGCGNLAVGVERPDGDDRVAVPLDARDAKVGCVRPTTARGPRR